MKPTNHHLQGKVAMAFFALTVLLSLLSFQTISAQQQTSNFSIARWVSGNSPVFTGSSTNVPALNYGDSLSTIVSFNGAPDDGLGVDFDNMASMSFAYDYSVYLTRVGDSFSTTTSLPIGRHSLSAYQSCSSGIVPPWTIGYDDQLVGDTNQVNMNIHDAISSCIPAGDYQVDIAIDTFSVNSVGPNPLPIELAWGAYTYNSNTLTTLDAPSSSNTGSVALNPIRSYMLSQIAFVHVNQSVSCPAPSIILPDSSMSGQSANTVSATISYPGICPQSPCTYLWSDGETEPTASHLGYGIYTVTVTTPCGTTASATGFIYRQTIRNGINPVKHVLNLPGLNTVCVSKIGSTTLNRSDKKLSDNSSENNVVASLNLYPNPAMNTINFDLNSIPGTNYSIRIYDVVGNEVMTSASNAGNQKVSLNIAALQSGVYLYEVNADKAYKGKFVKQ